jgi:hypothetical protein
MQKMSPTHGLEMKRYLVIGLLLIGCSKHNTAMIGRSGGALPGVPSAPIHAHETWIAFGQSNMSGDGQQTAFPDNPNVTMINPGHSNNKGLGVGFAWARNQEGVSVTLVQCAVGGMTMDHFEPGGDLYNRCLDICAQNGITQVDGILFDQGQSDAMLKTPTDWSYKFVSMVYGFRAYFHNDNLPVIFGRIGSKPDGYTVPYYDDIRGQQTTIHMNNVVMYDQDGAPEADGWHYDIDGMTQVGAKMERAFRFMNDQF